MSRLDHDDLDQVDEADGRPASRRGGMDAGTRQLAMIAGGIGAVLVVVVGGWSLLGHRQSGIPVIMAPSGPVRVKPVDPGGLKVMGTQPIGPLENGAQSLAPGPEAPRPEALQAEMGGGTSDAGTGTAAGGSSGPATEAAKPPVLPAPHEVAPAVVPAAPSAPAVVPPPARPPAVAAPAASGTERSSADTATPALQHAEGRYAVQLAALDSQAAAETEWARLTRQAPDLLKDRSPVVTETSRDGKRFFRLRTGGFATIAAANSFCSTLRARGVACTPAGF
jgi:septal ring-binding cell division protein DamX